MLLQDIGGNLVSLVRKLAVSDNERRSVGYLLDELNDRARLKFRSSFAKLLKGNESRIRVAENTMTIPKGT
jgi:hypothetical protein